MTEAVVVRNEGGHSRRIGERGFAIVEEMAANGCSEASIAKRLRIASSTFRDIKKRQPEVAEALERGYAAMEDELVDLLMLRARDVAHPGGTTAAIFLLKARRGYEGTKVPTHITINQDNRRQTMLLPQPADMDSYMRRVREA